MRNFSFSPQVAAQIVTGIKAVSSHELTADDRHLIARMEKCGRKDVPSLETYAAQYMELFGAR